jgi:integrase/recombinase XerD
MRDEVKDLSPFPIFGTFKQTKGLSKSNPYPDECPFIRREILSTSLLVPECEQDYIETVDFLAQYGRVSAQTFNAFRTEVERFLLWAWIIKEKSIVQLRRTDLNDYIDFCISPLTSWVNTHQERHFVNPSSDKACDNSSPLDELVPNKDWKPFKVPKEDFSERAIRIKRKPSRNTVNRQFSIMSVFYTHLVTEDYALGNPIPAVKKFSPYLVKTSEPPEIKTLSREDWNMVLDLLTDKANEDPKWERNLFAIVTLKSLYLRVSEISERDNWSPVMSHFYKYKGFFWFKAFGKGRKERRVSVPNEYLAYLERYRRYRGLTDLPDQNDSSPLLHKEKGTQGLSIRQATRLIEDSFAHVSKVLIESEQDRKAQEISVASSHWLRHTGASHDVETRPLKHLSDDLGHSNMGTTDKNYVQSTLVDRAKSGVDRKV